jgi:hypothetical protein
MYEEILKKLAALTDEVERLAALEVSGSGSGAHDHSYLESTGFITVDLGDTAGIYEFQVRDSANAEQFTVDSDGNMWFNSGYIFSPSRLFMDSADDVIVGLGDAAGAKEFRVYDSANVKVANIDSDGNLELSGAAAVSGALSVTGAITSTGNITTLGNLNVTGTINATGNVTVIGDITVDDITADDIVLDNLKAEGGTAALWFDNRTDTTKKFAWYAHDGVAALYSNVPTTDVLQITSGGAVTASGQVKSQAAVGGGDALGLYVESTVPGLALKDTAGGTDKKLWDLFVTGGNLKLRAVNDANSAAVDALVVTRGTGTAISHVEVPSGLRLPRSSGSAVFGIDAANTGSTIVIANNATATPFGSGTAGGTFSGLVLINNITNGINTMNICGSAVIGQTASAAGYFSTTQGTASRVNVYYTAGPNYDFTIENKTGASVTLHVFAIRTRAGA